MQPVTTMSAALVSYERREGSRVGGLAIWLVSALVSAGVTLAGLHLTHAMDPGDDVTAAEATPAPETAPAPPPAVAPVPTVIAASSAAAPEATPEAAPASKKVLRRKRHHEMRAAIPANAERPDIGSTDRRALERLQRAQLERVKSDDE